VARVDLGVTEEMEEGQKSFASLKMWLTIWELWDFRTDTRYDIAAGELARCNSNVGLHPHERVDLKFGDVYYPRLEGDDNLDVSATVILKILEGLSLSCEAIYDTNEADLEEMEFSVQKSLHCWDTILSYSKRREDDEQQIAFGLCLRAVPDFNFHFSGGFGGVE
jgi:hypothetical protein